MNKLILMYGTPVPYGMPIEELEKRLDRPDPTAWAAITALAHDPDPRALEVLVRYAHSLDWTFRRICIEAISQHLLAQQASSLILASLHDPSPYVVRTACIAVVHLGLAEGHDDLLA